MLQIIDLLVKKESFEALLCSLNISDGQCVALCGVSGSGKSTLLEAISLVSPYKSVNTFNLDGYDIDALDENILEDVRIVKLGLMPQVGGLIPFLTIRENIGLQIELAAKAALRLKSELLVKDQTIEYDEPEKATFSQEKLYEYVKLFKLEEHLNKLPHELSIGQRQRALFLRAISHNPRLILIDEPTASLDPENAEILFKLIDEIALTSKISVLMVTHDERAMRYYKSYIFNAKRSRSQHCVFEDEVYVNAAMPHHEARQALEKSLARSENKSLSDSSSHAASKEHHTESSNHAAPAENLTESSVAAPAPQSNHINEAPSSYASETDVNKDSDHNVSDIASNASTHEAAADEGASDKAIDKAITQEAQPQEAVSHEAASHKEDSHAEAPHKSVKDVSGLAKSSEHEVAGHVAWPQLSLFKLALKDLFFDRLMSICMIAALASIIAPLLLLFSLRFGVLQELEHKLLSDPNVLSISLISSYQLDDNFFNNLEQNPYVGFVVPEVNAINAIIDIKFKGGVERANALPTALHDPVVVKSNIPYSHSSDELQEKEIFISDELSKKRNVKVGDEVNVLISRIQNGERQALNIPMKVKGIINPGYILKDAVLLNLKTLEAIDDFRTGYNPNIISDGSLVKDTKRYYAKFRLYAKDIDSVIPLFYELQKKNLSLNSKVGEIENIKAIDRVLNFVFLVVALVSSIGGTIALGGLIFGSLKMRRKNFVVLRMIGQRAADTYLMVLIEALCIAVLGFAFALVLFFVGSDIFNRYFSAVLGGGSISLLTYMHALIFFGVTILVSAIIAMISAKYVFLKAQIADVLREA